MDDGRIDDEDYILFYAYGPNEWNDESQTAVNLYHDKAHYIISYGGVNGLRVNPQSSLVGIDNPQTSASVSIHFEHDLINIAQMGRKWFGDRFLHNSSEKYPFQLTNRKAATTVAVKLAAAASAVNGSSFDLSVENQNTSLNIAPTQTLTRAEEGTITLSSNPSSNELDVVLNYDASGFSSAVGYLGLYTSTYERSLSGDRGQFSFRTSNSNAYHASDADAIWEFFPNGTINVFQSNSNREVYFTSNEHADRYHLYSANDFYSPKRSEYGDTFNSPQLRKRLSNEAEYIIITHDDFVEEAKS